MYLENIYILPFKTCSATITNPRCNASDSTNSCYEAFSPRENSLPPPVSKSKRKGKEGKERFDIHRERTSFGRVGARSAKKSDVSEVCRLTNGRSPRSEASPFKLEVIGSEPLTVRTIEKKKKKKKERKERKKGGKKGRKRGRLRKEEEQREEREREREEIYGG